MRRTPLFLCLTLLSPPATANRVLVFSDTFEGAVTITGNTLGLSKSFNENAPGTRGSIGAFTTTDTELQDGTFPIGTTDSWALNASSAELVMPKYNEVIYAELIWGGSYNYFSDVSSFLDDDIRFETPEGLFSVSPRDETATTLATESHTGFLVNYYLRSADVTDLVQDAGDGTYTVGGVPATQDMNINELNAAGWSLIVAYREQSRAARNITIFVGAEWVDEAREEGDAIDTVAAGFCAPPTGTVEGRLLVNAMEGDAHFDGDMLMILGPESEEFISLSGPNNPVGNFFASQINDFNGELDETGLFGTRNHDPFADPGDANVLGGRQGWDLTAVNLSSRDGHLANEQRETTIRATSTIAGDSYVLMALAFEIDVNAPDFDVEESSLVEPTTADLDDVLSYSFELANDGAADASNVVFFHPLAEGTSLVADSFEIDGDTGDVDGDPVTARDLRNGVNVGDVGVDRSIEIHFRARVDALPRSEPAVFATQASWAYEWLTCSGEDPTLGISEGAVLEVATEVATLDEGGPEIGVGDPGGPDAGFDADRGEDDPPRNDDPGAEDPPVVETDPTPDAAPDPGGAPDPGPAEEAGAQPEADADAEGGTTVRGSEACSCGTTGSNGGGLWLILGLIGLARRKRLTSNGQRLTEPASPATLLGELRCSARPPLA
jgi:uncharacterized repeat protein (TIGR01451 family)